MKSSISIVATLLNALAFSNADNPSDVRSLLRKTSQQQLSESDNKQFSFHSENAHQISSHAEIGLANHA